MKLEHFLTAAAAITALTTTREASAAFPRCQQDALTLPSQATGRNEWALVHGYIDQATYDFLQAQGYYVVFDKGSYKAGVDGDPTNPKVWISPDKPTIGYTNIFVDTVCAGHCYTPQQRIMTERGMVRVQDAHTSGIETVMAVTVDSSFGNVQFAPQPIQQFIFGDTQELIFVLEGDDGQKLEVTSQHPMVLATGQIVDVRTLQLGDVLLGEHGQPVLVKSIETFMFEGQVWNLQPESELVRENILVAEGFLTGSLRLQSMWAEDATRLIRRDMIQIPPDASE